MRSFTKLKRKSSGRELARGGAAIEAAQLAQQPRQIRAAREPALERAAVAERRDMRGAIPGALRAREARAQPELRKVAQRIGVARDARDRVAVDLGLELEDEPRDG